MNCRLTEFDLNKTWIILTAGKKNTNKKDLYLEHQILNSLVKYVKSIEPECGTKVYGKVADILLFEDNFKILDIPGIGIVSRSRIMEIRNYLNGKDIYRWIFDKSKTINGKRKEVHKMALFGDVVDEIENGRHLDKEYEICINGYLVSDDEAIAGYKKKRFLLNLTKEEYSGIEKLFNVLDESRLSYITGLGVENKNV